jgi:hypothetical protein
MKADPKPRKDGRCAGPGCKRKCPKWKKSAYASGADYATNAFCARKCVEAYFEIEKPYVGEKT